MILKQTPTLKIVPKGPTNQKKNKWGLIEHEKDVDVFPKPKLIVYICANKNFVPNPKPKKRPKGLKTVKKAKMGPT